MQCPSCASKLSFDRLTDTLSIATANESNGSSSRVTGSFRGRLGDYEIESEIARGGMGVVYRARQMSLKRLVAVKVIGKGEFATTEEVQRFQTEARAAAALDHPGIVPVFEVGQDGDTHFFSMGLVEGKSLSARLTDGPLEPTEAARLTCEIAKAVQYAHDNGVIHRDLKPQNVLLDESGVAKVTDFGLAKELESNSELTHTGQILGTPSYMSPEQARGLPVGKEADIYSLGALLYSLITGRPPHQGASAAETLILVLNSEVCPPRRLNPRIPRDLETICLKAISSEPSKRFSSVAALSDDLQRFVDGEPIRSRPIGPAGRAVKLCRRYPKTAALFCVFLLSFVGVVGFAFYAHTQTELAKRREWMTLHTLERRDRTSEYMKIQKKYKDLGIAEERMLGYFRTAVAYRDHRDWDKCMECLKKALAVENGSEEMYERARTYIGELREMMKDAGGMAAEEAQHMESHAS